LPVDRAELVLKLQHATGEEAFDGLPGLRQHLAVGREAWPLQGEDEAVRRLVMPLGEARRLLRTVIGAVDLDRGQLRGGIFQLALLRQLLRIEGTAAPRLIGPAADADADPPFAFIASLLRHGLLPLFRRIANLLPVDGCKRGEAVRTCRDPAVQPRGLAQLSSARSHL